MKDLKIAALFSLLVIFLGPARGKADPICDAQHVWNGGYLLYLETNEYGNPEFFCEHKICEPDPKHDGCYIWVFDYMANLEDCIPIVIFTGA
jgi:hypothetical protein